MSLKKSILIKQYVSCLDEDDVIVFAGNMICREYYNNDKYNILCIDDDDGYGLSMVLGIAMGTKKRVFLFCEDYYLLKDLGAVAHLGISRLVNLFIVVLVSGTYFNSENLPTITYSIPNIKSLLFSMGFVVHDYTKHFKTQETIKQTKSIISSAKGPLAVFIRLEKTKNNNLVNVSSFNFEEQVFKFRKDLKEESTALFKSPLVVVDKEEIIKNVL